VQERFRQDQAPSAGSGRIIIYVVIPGGMPKVTGGRHGK
jgi:hypothetical protein